MSNHSIVCRSLLLILLGNFLSTPASAGFVILHGTETKNFARFSVFAGPLGDTRRDDKDESEKIPAARVGNSVSMKGNGSTSASAYADAIISPNSAYAYTRARVITDNPVAEADAQATSQVRLKVEGMSSIDYAVTTKGPADVLINNRNTPQNGTLSVSDGSVIDLKVSVRSYTFPSGPGLFITERHAKIMLTETGVPPEGTLEQSAPNRYEGIFPTIDRFGRTGPMYLTGQSAALAAFSSLSTASSQLTYSVVENSFASVEIPGAAGGDPMTLVYADKSVQVEPGSTFSFLSELPEITTLSLLGDSLSANSVLGFKFNHDGAAVVTLAVGQIPEPASLFLFLLGCSVGMNGRTRL